MSYDDGFGSQRVPLYACGDRGAVSEPIIKRIAEAIEIGRADSDGEHTATGLAFELMCDLGYFPEMRRDS